MAPVRPGPTRDSSRSATASCVRAARMAGGTRPTSPIKSATISPQTSNTGVTGNAKAR